MARIHLEQTTTATPEQFVAALTDFGPGRSELFGRSVWERLHTTNVDVVVVRDGKNLKGRAIGALLSVAGKQILGGTRKKTVQAVEARGAGTRTTERT